MDQNALTSLQRDWNQLLKEGQRLSFRRGQVLFYEGHAPYGIFVIHSGKVRFLKGDRPCGEEHTLYFPQGKVLGVHPFFEGALYCCTCVASQTCRATFISKTQLLPFLRDDPDQVRK